MSNQDRIEAIKDRMPDQRWRGLNFGYPQEWEDLIIEVDEKLAALDPDYAVNQVKEKFWGLRYYFTPSEGVSAEVVNQMRDIVADAEDRSYALLKRD